MTLEESDTRNVPARHRTRAGARQRQCGAERWDTRSITLMSANEMTTSWWCWSTQFGYAGAR
jgi:hypothetical protein